MTYTRRPQGHITPAPTGLRPVQVLERRGLVGLAVALGLLLLTSASGRAALTPRPAVRPSPEVVARHQILWGAWVGNAYGTVAAPWDMATLTTLTRSVHKSPSIVEFYQDFEDCWSGCSLTPFPRRYMSAIRARGSIPLLSWASMASTPGADAGRLSLASIASGKLDGYLWRFARAARAWGHPFFLRFDWEMNGSAGGFPWRVGQRGNSAELYVAAFRRVHDIFAAAGATNVTWVWCPLANSRMNLRTLRRSYPGNAYVNWTGLDGYNWGRDRDWGGWMSFRAVYRRSYDVIRRIAPDKPMMVAEFGSTENGGSKAAWLRNALAAVPRYFKSIRAILYFDNWSDGMDWPLNSSWSAERAFERAIQNPVYASNRFARLRGSGPILP